MGLFSSFWLYYAKPHLFFCSFRAFGKMIGSKMASISPYIHEIRLNVSIRDCAYWVVYSESARFAEKAVSTLILYILLRADFAVWQFVHDLSKYNSHFLFYIGLF